MIGKKHGTLMWTHDEVTPLNSRESEIAISENVYIIIVQSVIIKCARNKKKISTLGVPCALFTSKFCR